MKDISKVKSLLKDNKGNALIKVAGIIICLLLLAYGVYFYQTTVAVIRQVKDTGQICLDNYTIKTGIEIVDSIKNGNDYSEEVKPDVFLSEYRTSLHISSNYTGYTDGAVRFAMSDIKTSFIINQQLKTQVHFILHVPVYLMGKKILTMDIPVEISSRYNAKVDITE